MAGFKAASQNSRGQSMDVSPVAIIGADGATAPTGTVADPITITSADAPQGPITYARDTNNLIISETIVSGSQTFVRTTTRNGAGYVTNRSAWVLQ